MWVWLAIIITFFLLNLNGGVACALSFWAIIGLHYYVNKRRAMNQKPKTLSEMGVYEQGRFQTELANNGCNVFDTNYIRQCLGDEGLKMYCHTYFPHLMGDIVRWYDKVDFTLTESEKEVVKELRRLKADVDVVRKKYYKDSNDHFIIGREYDRWHIPEKWNRWRENFKKEN